jgi:hypothetical protein
MSHDFERTANLLDSVVVAMIGSESSGALDETPHFSTQSKAWSCRKAAALLALFIAARSYASATDYFISPTGSDRNNGLDAGHPWLTFRRAQRKDVLAPGNRLILLDGEYTVPTNGRPSFNCSPESGNALNGTDGSHVTITAQNERKAWVHGDGAADTLRVYDCRYYDIVGLNISMADTPIDNSIHALEITGPTSGSISTHVTIKRNILHHDNRYSNSHLVAISRSTYWLTEENEYYFFHRHAEWHGSGADFGESRRNYANSRRFDDLPGCGAYPAPNCSGGPGGDESFSNYPGSNNVFENDISEGSLDGFTVNASGTSVNNRYYGDISLNDRTSWRIVARGSDLSNMPVNTEVRDAVMIVSANSQGVVWISSSKNTIFEHASLFVSNALQRGFRVDSQRTKGDGALSLSIRNTFIKGIAADGVSIEDPPLNSTTLSWTVDHVWSNGPLTAFTPSGSTRNGKLTNTATTDPGVGTCRLWVPTAAAAHGAGSGGSDIGATILYKYENGVLTRLSLWDPSTGAFLGSGAIVAGLNDIPGSSLFDVHKRLNVNQNGCPFPPGYSPTPAPRPMPGQPSSGRRLK